MDLRTPSKLECEDGDFVLDPELLAARFSLSVERLRRLLRAGLVKSTVEEGRDADEGRRRLTVRCGNRAWTAVVDENGEVIGENLVVLRHVPPPRAQSPA
jgi:hypothetical protein